MKRKLFACGLALPTSIVLGLSGAPALQAQTTLWTSGDGLWSVPGNWNNGSPNGATFDAVIDPAGPGVAVTLDVSRTINDLTIGEGDSLLFNNNTTLTIAGDTLNDGLIQFNSIGNTTGITLLGAGPHLMGGSGILRLGSGTTNRIGGSGRLVHSAGHTIEGGGSVGQAQIGIDNAGLIQANQAGATMTLQPGAGGMTNTGTLRAQSEGVLLLAGTGGFDNNGGLIEALADSQVRLNGGVVITGGTLSTTGNGEIRVNASQTVTLDGVINAGNLYLENNSLLILQSSLVNSGSITTRSIGNPTNLRVDTGGVILSGGGTLNFQNSATTGISGEDGARLTNVDNLIRGFGNIGQNSAAITNEAGGVIDADVSGTSLTLDPVATAGDGNPSFINNGILRASNGGSLILTGSGGGDFTNNNLIAALGGSVVQLTNDARMIGGTLSTSGDGLIQVNASQNVFLTNLSNTGNFVALNNSDLGISGTIGNSGSITLKSIGNQTDLEIQAGGATLNGGGVLIMEAGTTGINSAVLGTRLTHTGHTIRGQGLLGQNNTAITNSATGLIEANIDGETLTLDPALEANVVDGGASFINDGILRASNGGRLVFTGNGGGAFTNNNLIEALAGSVVELTGTARITGGTLSTTGDGLIEVNGSQNVYLTNLSNVGNIVALNNSDLGISGSIINSGSITLRSIGNQTDLEIQAGGATLTGGGTVTLEDGTTGINSAVTGTRFTNFDNTIQGQGSIGQNNTAITNSAGGLIHANISGQTLTLNPVAEGNVIDLGASFINDGILRASGGGRLALTGLGGGAFTNNNRIEALDGSLVQLAAGATIIGGTISTSGTGLIEVGASQNVFLVGVANEGNIVTLNNTDLGLSGMIGNSGTITLTSFGNQSDLEIQAGGATLTGGGTVTLNAITGVNSATTGTRLTISANTIQGIGNIGRNNTAITNGSAGLINANVAGQTLVIDSVQTALDGGPSFLNEGGTVRASNGGILTLSGLGGGAFTNGGNGTFEAFNGSTFNMVSAAVLTNNAAGTLTGGVYRVQDTGSGGTMALLGTPVTTIAPNTLVDLSGANSVITFNGTALSSSLVSNQGTLLLRDGRVFDNVNSLTNAGTLELRGGTFSAPTLVNGNNGLIIGYGNVNVRPGNSGEVVADGGTLAFSNGISAGGGTSSITINPGASLDISAGANSGAAFLAHNGANLNLGDNDIVVSSDYTNQNFGTGNAFNARANVSGSGEILASGNTAQSITGDVSGNAIVFGNVHVGDVVTKNYQIANTGTTGPALRGAIQTLVNGGNITDSRLGGSGVTAGNFGLIATNTDSGDLGVTFNATSAGVLSGQAIHIENNFDNVADSNISITGAAYRLASASVAPNPVDFGIIHVGDVVSQNLTVQNTAVNDSFSESLVAGFGGSTFGVVAGGSITGLTAGETDSSSLVISVDTSSAGFISGTAFLDLESDGTVTSGLGVTSISGLEVGVTAQVNNYARAIILFESGSGILTQDSENSYTLDFGTRMVNSSGGATNLVISNDVLGPADTLAGSFDLSGAEGFFTSGFFDFNGIEAGDNTSPVVITIDTSTERTFNSEIFLDTRSQNASGYDGALGRITLSLRGTVAIPEPSSALLVGLAMGFGLLRRNRSGMGSRQ